MNHRLHKQSFFFREWVNLSILALFFILAIVTGAAAPRPGGMLMSSFDPITGEVVTYNSVFTTVMLLPLIALIIYVLLTVLPSIAVYKRTIEDFYKRHFGFKMIILMFLLVVYVAVLMPAFGIRTNQMYFIVPALSAMLFYIGHLLRNLHRNYFFGIRTPWTLARDSVWNKTHKFGSAVFEICAVFLLLGLRWPDYFPYIVLVTVAAGVIICIVYSYLMFNRNHV